MKSIREATSKISEDQIISLSSLFKLNSSTLNNIISSLLTYTGLDVILSSLELDELNLLRIIYNGKDGVNFGEIEKELKIGIQHVEKVAENLSQKLLIYTLKNRQLLNNKLDKVYGITEISQLINIVEPGSIRDHLKKVTDYIGKKEKDEKILNSLSGEKEIKFLRFIAESGGIIALSELQNRYDDRDLDKIIPALISKGFIQIYYCVERVFNTFILLNEKIFPAIINSISKETCFEKTYVHNGCYAVLNLLRCYDTISTYGLFLTKQHEFRKIDRKRIMESMLDLKNCSSEPQPEELISDMILYIFDKLNCLTLQKDIITISLKNIKKDIDNPKKIIARIIKAMDSPPKNLSLFPAPGEEPDFQCIQILLNLVFDLHSAPLQLIETTALIIILSQMKKKSLAESLKQRRLRLNTIQNAVNFLILVGVFDYHKGELQFSDIGQEIAASVQKISYVPKAEKVQKSIYINPDFTIIIPTHEISSTTLFHLLGHTDVIKQDVLLHALISKSSIVKAQKRGMSLKHFLETLKMYSKNELPQNLDFLLNEWSTQTIKLDISRNILIKSSHPAFLEEMAMGKLKEAIIEKISPLYAVISKKYIDDIISFAKKKDAVINLFMNSEDDEED